MNNKNLVSISLALFLGMGIGAGALHWIGASKASTPKVVGKTGGESERKILYWRNPMNSSIHADHPMKDNMGMDYIPVYGGAASSSGKSVSVNSGIRQTLGIRVVPVVHRNFSRSIRTAATVTYDKHRIRVITARFLGWIRNLPVRSVGDLVRKGEIIAWIYSPELASSEAEAIIALQALNKNPSWKDNQKIWDAAKDRLHLLGVADSEINRLKQTGKSRSVIPVYSPYSGVVTSISAQVGGAISPEKSLMTLADPTRVWVDVFFTSPELAWVKDGDTVTLHLPYLASRRYKGRLRFINPEVEKTSRTIRARVVVQNPDGVLKAGMYLEAVLHPDPHPNALVIPREALIRTGKKTVVITEVGQGRFRPVRVTIGARSPHRVEVISGLREGERVVVSGQFLLDAESRFENVSDRMDEGGHP
uniref:Secretion protein (HlyD) n=2 Tax=Leptospirillum TaxID=179 RepID=C6HUR0_9BACT|nr:MAG: Putative heavy metal efflux protein, CzcB [Leptospirillum sp. Group II '5-way CG']EES53686.1 MAG: Secretion protein (HlyD) [Leptospirillum ferrodiazotrophum]